MLREVLLTIHVLAVIVWLGCGLYEFFLAHEIKKARGTHLEIPLIQLYGKYAPVVAVATLVVATAGILMSIFLGWGFFQHVWLGRKQLIMLLVIADMLLLLRTFKLATGQINSLADDPSVLPAYHKTFAKIERHVLLMRLGAVIAVVLAIFRPV